MEQSEGGEQSQQQPQPWGKLIRLGADEAEPHVLLLKREWTIGRKKGGTGTRCAGLGRCSGTAAIPPPGLCRQGAGLKLVGFGASSCWGCLPGPSAPVFPIFVLAV